MKIKKQLNLPQLIEWAWENDVRDKVFWTTKDKRGASYEACFSEGGNFYSDDILDSNVIFTVEVEEEITEDTHLDYLYVLTDAKDVYRCNNFTIKSTSLVIGQDDLTFFTLIDNDLVKICDKGKMVE